MFLDFYNLSDQPFGVTPDSRFLYMGPEHREALASLIYTTRMGRGFHALIAPPGMGKTTLLFHLLEYLKPTARSVFLFQTQCDKHEFLRYLMADLGLESPDNDYVRMHSRLNEFLVKNAEEGKQFILVIDEAQNLSDEVLEAIRLLSDFETSRRKLMHIILTGQPQLARKLSRPNLEQLRQRISLVSQLKPLDVHEVRRYIEHRLKTAGHQGEAIFTAEALGIIARHSEGIPRNINNICFGALSLGFANGKKKIDAKIIQEVIASRSLELVLPQQPTVPVHIAEPDGARASVRNRTSPEPAVEYSATRRQPAARTSSWMSRLVLYGTAVAALALVSLTWPFGSSEHSNKMSSTAPEPLQASQPGQKLQKPVIVTGTIDVSGTDETQNFRGGSASVADADLGAAQTIIVKPNDTLWSISEAHLGRANPEILNQIIRLNGDDVDPKHLQAGQRVRLPALAEPDQFASAADTNSKSVRAEERGKP